MMMSLMMYGVVAALLLGVAGLASERVLRWYGSPTRWVWMTTIGLTLVLPFVPAFGAPRADATTLSWTILSGSAESLEAAVPSGIAGGASIAAVLAAAGPWLWAGASLLLLAVAGLSLRRLYRRRTTWRRSTVQGESVRLSEDFGPAVLGFLRPEIVLPRSALDLSAREVDLILRHEAEHVRAHDPMVLALSSVIVILFPWNLPLVWQAMRLRRAVEVDCDRRVLQSGASRKRYAELLVEVASRASGFPMPVAALAERRSFLEERLDWIRSERIRKRSARAALGVVVVAGALGLVFNVPRPFGQWWAQQEADAHDLAFSPDVEAALAELDREVQFELQEKLEKAELVRRRVEIEAREAEMRAHRFEAEARRVEREARKLEGVALRRQLEGLERQEVERLRREADEVRASLEAIQSLESVEALEEFRFRTNVKLERLERERLETAVESDGVVEILEEAPRLRFGEEGSPEPMVFVDGEEVDPATLEELSPDRIDRVEVIKGEAARSVYGAEGANGVIQIFLKKKNPS
jgi:beta-lactamase regulating signal transducer with metallopeptidase domain